LTAPAQLRLPDYGGRCFDGLPGTIERLLAGTPGGFELGADVLAGTYDHVVLVYLDAFGWRFLEQQADHPLLARAAVVERLTSQFPSTTTVHTTTIHTGLPVGDHGLYEWYVYEPSLDRIICPLVFSFAGDGELDTLLRVGFGPDDLYPPESLYERLGVPTHGALPAAVAGSVTTHRLGRGAIVHPFDSTAHGLELVGTRLKEEERAYGFVYLPDVDALMHAVGPDASEVAELFAETLTTIDAALHGGAFPAGTLVLLTSDHGMSAVSPERTAYVNVVWPALEQLVARGADGLPLAPAGSCRDLFLHVQPGRTDEVVDGLRRRLEGVADVYATAELVEWGAFGPAPSEALLRRLADVVCLPHPGEAVYWLEPGRFEQHFHGQHGGLSSDELDIPLVALVTE
jgi:hypothetical protein